MTDRARQAARAILAAIDRARPGWRPEVGIVLGSGLGAFADSLDDPLVLPYGGIEGFPVCSVEGHAGRLVLGEAGGRRVACMQGRVHLFEGAAAADIATPVRALHLAGCFTLVLTNASGSLRPEAVPPGSLMAVSDHINMMQFNPLAGANDDSFGPRFPAMDAAYDPALRTALRAAAEATGTVLHEGVYVAVSGPSFETPAEIRAFRMLGGDVVGMSTVPEVIVARHCGMRVAAISCAVCPAAGLGAPITHEQTLAVGALGAAQLVCLLPAFLERLPDAG
ncbi:MAG: purine nucleoside phosphorylase [Alphaproteobacteria bacterium]|nr:MAG: purine nucleoside phosphorylase [Alphaproteobacteria bacterium]